MKTHSIPHHNCLNAKYLFLILLFFPLIQSCFLIKDAEVSASFEAAYQEFCGPSYPFPSCDEHDLGYNIFALLMMDEDDFYSLSANVNPDQDQWTMAGTSSFGASQLYADNRFSKHSYTSESTTFRHHLHLMPGLGYVNKRSVDGDQKIGLHYLEIPIYLLYQMDLKKGNAFGGLGPYFAYGIGGKIRSKTTDIKRKSFDSTDGFRPFDGGLALTIGYHTVNDIRLRLGFDIGLANIERNSGGNKTKNRAFSVNVSCPFNKLVTMK
ncbi:MAG: porin family protein [Saprospiraceae bacterium]